MATTGKTTRDLELTAWGSTFTLPQGSRVRLIPQASGTEGDLWAVDSERQLMELTGNTHDPKYRYCWVPADAVQAD